MGRRSLLFFWTSRGLGRGLGAGAGAGAGAEIDCGGGVGDRLLRRDLKIGSSSDAVPLSSESTLTTNSP